MFIIKRDGQRREFNADKITLALAKAGQATGEFREETALRLCENVLQQLEQRQPASNLIEVEQVQDCVEDVLLESRYKKTAKAYVLYREQHAQLRALYESENVAMVDDYLSQLDWKVTENANMTFSIQGLNNYLAGNLNQTYWLQKLYPPAIREAHTQGDLHIHDLAMLSVYCVGWDLYDVLQQGFTGVRGKIQCAPAKHFRTALGQMVNFLYTLQGEATGAQAFSNVDTLLAPFIRYDGLDDEQVYQALQEFVYNLNVPTRTGFQTPFTNITLDLTVPKHYASQPVLIGGELQQETYSDFQEEMNRFNRILCEVLMAGDDGGQVFTFPIPTYNITPAFDWQASHLEPLWEMAAKYGIPYFSNFVNSDLSPEDARSMCCRLRIDNRSLDYRGGGLFGSHPLTGSIGVVTINLPRLGVRASGEDDFMQLLSEQMQLARESLDIKRHILENLTDKELYPYTKFYLRDIKARYNLYWKNHFSTIGLVGMNEACLNLLGQGIETPQGHEFAQRVLQHMRNEIQRYQEDSGTHYNLEATPAEGTAYRFAKLDKRLYPQSICANQAAVVSEGAEPLYTNSTYLPVHATQDVFALLDHQDPLQTQYTGGKVVHLFAGERMSDPQVLKQLVRNVCHQYRLPYFTFSPTFSTCPNHGYLKGEHHECPECHSACDVFSRVVGYIRPVRQWNDGKQAEWVQRTPLVFAETTPRVCI
ncbi:MAG: ribonucleoside triphosphate reductase [Vampirovibrionales bacterium]